MTNSTRYASDWADVAMAADQRLNSIIHLLHVPCVHLGIICHIIRDFHLSCDFSAVLRGAAEQVLEESDSDICSDVGTVLADQNDLGKEDSEL